MTCREFLDEVELLALGEVGPARAGALRDHAAACGRCSLRLAEAEALNEKLRGLKGAYVPPAGLEERVRRSLDAAAPPAAVRRFRGRRWIPAAVAAGIVVAVAALFMAGPGPAVPDLIASTISAHEELLERSRAGRIDTSDPKALGEFFAERVEGRSAPGPGGCCCATKGACQCADPAVCRQGACSVYRCGDELVTRLAVDASRMGSVELERGEKRLVEGREVYLFESRGVRVAACPCAKAVHLWVGRLEKSALFDTMRAAGRRDGPAPHEKH